MPLIRDNRIVDDPWVSVDDAAPLPGNAWPIVDLERWQAERDVLTTVGMPLGLRLRSDQSPRAVADDLRYFALIALEFPKFTDGRPYSGARLLRERYGYTGELRAVGHVLLDQAGFLARCGFDAFEVPDGTTPDAWSAALARISVRYQRAADARSTATRGHRARPRERPGKSRAPLLGQLDP